MFADFFFKLTFQRIPSGIRSVLNSLEHDQAWSPRLKNFFHVHLSIKFQLLIRTKMLKIKSYLALKCSDIVFILLINDKNVIKRIQYF